MGRLDQAKEDMETISYLFFDLIPSIAIGIFNVLSKIFGSDKVNTVNQHMIREIKCHLKSNDEVTREKIVKTYEEIENIECASRGVNKLYIFLPKQIIFKAISECREEGIAYDELINKAHFLMYALGKYQKIREVEIIKTANIYGFFVLWIILIFITDSILLSAILAAIVVIFLYFCLMGSINKIDAPSLLIKFKNKIFRKNQKNNKFYETIIKLKKLAIEIKNSKEENKEKTIEDFMQVIDLLEKIFFLILHDRGQIDADVLEDENLCSYRILKRIYREYPFISESTWLKILKDQELYKKQKTEKEKNQTDNKFSEDDINLIYSHITKQYIIELQNNCKYIKKIYGCNALLFTQNLEDFRRIPSEVKKKICEIARNEQISQVTLFGSRATNNFQKKDDIDIAVWGEKTKVKNFIDNVDRISETLLTINIVNMEAEDISNNIKNSVLKTNRIIYQQNDS